MTIAKNPDVVAAGLSELLSQFDEAANLRALLAAILRPIQSIEDDACDVLEKMPLDVAEGVNLDVWGEIANVARDGRDDDTYRALIAATVTAQRASGTINAVIELVSELAGGAAVFYFPDYPAKFRLGVQPTTPLTDQQKADIVAALEAVVAAGVGYRVLEAPPVDAFRFNAPGPGFDIGRFSSFIAGT